MNVCASEAQEKRHGKEGKRNIWRYRYRSKLKKGEKKEEIAIGDNVGTRVRL